MFTGTGVKIEDGRTAVLVEAELPDKETYQEPPIRGVELLWHLHVAVLQFSLEGKLIIRIPKKQMCLVHAAAHFRECSWMAI
jgi:hypothetical protein